MTLPKHHKYSTNAIERRCASLERWHIDRSRTWSGVHRIMRPDELYDGSRSGPRHYRNAADGRAPCARSVRSSISRP